MAYNTLELVIKAQNYASKELIKINKQVKGLAGGFKATGKSLADFGAKHKKTFKNMAILGVGAVTSITLATKRLISSANEELRVHKQLEAVLKSTGGAAGVTAEEVKQMASELQKVTTFGDETIVAGQNMLLTFTQIGKEVLPQATETLLDMATAINGGATPSAEQLRQQAIQLGKALNDPIIGMGALTRVGVRFTEKQKEQITTLVKAGEVMEAQKIILKELAVEFGGSARAQAETFEGKMLQLKNVLSDVEEEIGKQLIPILGELVETYKPTIIATAESTAEWFKNEKNIQKLKGTIETTIRVFKFIFNVIKAVTEIIYIMGGGLGLLTAKIVIFTSKGIEKFKEFADSVGAIFGALKEKIVSVFDLIKDFDKTKIGLNIGVAIGENLAKTIGGAARSAVNGARANGGPVTGGKTYLVGERGPELFTPRVSGGITANDKLGGNFVVNMNMGGVVINNEADENRLVEKIKEVWNDIGVRQAQLYNRGIL